MEKKLFIAMVALVCMFVFVFGAAANELIMGLGEEPETLDPNITTRFHSYVVLSYIVEPLFTLDESYEVIPLLVEDYDWADDGSVMKVRLKEGVLFHNGAEMTAEDVKASYERYFQLSPLASYLPPSRGGIYEMEIVDTYTLIFHFETPKPLALYIMADHHVGIMPKAWLESTSDSEIGLRALVGTGPYQFVEWVPGDRIVMERFDEYSHGPDFISNSGPAQASRLVFRIIPEDATMMAELVAGNVDVSFDVPPSAIRVLESRQGRVRIETAPTYSVQYLAMNMEREIFQDERVRQAIAHAINKEDISKAAWFGVGHPISGLINKATIGYWSAVEDLEYKHNMERAKELLDEAGWALSGGVRQKDGQPLSLTLLTFSNIDQWRKAGEIVQQQLHQIGIQVRLETAEVGAAYDRGNAGNYDIGIFRNTWWLGQPYLNFLTHSTNIGSSNYGRWPNPELDYYLETAGNNMDPAIRRHALNEVQRIVVESAIWVPLVSNVQIIAAKTEVQGVDELLGHPWWPSIMRALILHK